MLFIQLILAHIIGDFLLQPASWVAHKERHKHKSKFMYYHILVHLMALIVILKVDFSYWLGILIIIFSHYIIDIIKLQLNNKTGNPRLLFGLDQLAHLIIIAIVVHIYEPFNLVGETLFTPQILLFITCLLGVTVVASVIMKILISKWELEEDTKDESLESAGAYIGMLERLFVFVFIVMNYWEGIGFLIAAKSVFRFGDLSKAKDRKLTEYILIGTLLSFGLAISFGMIFKYVTTLL